MSITSYKTIKKNRKIFSTTTQNHPFLLFTATTVIIFSCVFLTITFCLSNLHGHFAKKCSFIHTHKQENLICLKSEQPRESVNVYIIARLNLSLLLNIIFIIFQQNCTACFISNIISFLFKKRVKYTNLPCQT